MFLFITSIFIPSPPPLLSFPYPYPFLFKLVKNSCTGGGDNKSTDDIIWGGGMEQQPPRFSPAVTPRWQGNLKADEPGADEAMEGFPVAGVVCPTYENHGDAGSAAHFLMNTANELSVGGDTACVQGDVKTVSTTACEQEWNAELDEVSVAGVVCPPYEDQSGAHGAALFLMSSANDVIDTINSDSLSLSTEAEAEKPNTCRCW
jgi:hypothetical protein